MARTRAGNLCNDKKGFSETYKMIMWVPRFLFTVVVIGITFYIILSFIVTKTNVSDVESNILMNTAYFSPTGFSVSDAETGRVYTSLVDPAKFAAESGVLESMFRRDRPQAVGRFVMKQVVIDGQLSPAEGKTTYTDREKYILWQPIAQVGGKGIGGKSAFPETRYVATADGAGKMVETVFIASN